MREAAIEQGLRLRLQRLGCLFYKWVSPGNNGVPDRIVITPDGSVIFVELKTSRGNLSPDQRVQIRKLEKHHARVVVIYGKQDADKFVKEMGEIHEIRRRRTDGVPKKVDLAEKDPR